MASVNRVIIIGNLGRDPECRTFPNGDMVANVSIATTDKWKDKQTGEMKEHTEWHRVVFNGRLAEIVDQYLRKGSQVYVEGGLRTRKWQDKDGKDCYSVEIRANEMQMLGSAPGGGDRDRGGYDDDRQDRGRGQGGNDRGGRSNDQGGRGDNSQRQGRQDDRQGGGRDGGSRGNDRGSNQQRGNDRGSGGQQRHGGRDGYDDRGGQQQAQRADSGFDSMEEDIPF